MKPSVMRSSRKASAVRPSVRAKVLLAGLKLIVPPDLDGLQTLWRRAEKTLGDVRETLARVRHIEAVEVVAQPSRGRAPRPSAPAPPAPTASPFRRAPPRPRPPPRPSR